MSSIAWIEQTGDFNAPDEVAPSDIEWSSERSLFVAIGACTTGTEPRKRVMTSPDGITWTPRTTPTGGGIFAWRGLAWSPALGLFVAVYGGGAGRVMTSPDGITWTEGTPASTDLWNEVAWSPELNLFVAVGRTAISGSAVMTSPDGFAWTLRTAAADVYWHAVEWSPELMQFVAIGGSTGPPKLMTSPDGITWTLATLPSFERFEFISGGAKSLAWSPTIGMWAALATLSSFPNVITMLTSSDGVTWTLQSIPSSGDTAEEWGSLIWVHNAQYGFFMAVRYSQLATSNRILISQNGVDWQLSLLTDSASVFPTFAGFSPELRRLVLFNDEGDSTFWSGEVVFAPMLIPNTGDIRCGTRVRIIGSNYDPEDTISVSFGDDVVLATVIDANTLEVFTPDHVAGTVDVTITQAQAGITEVVLGGFTFSDILSSGISIVPNTGPMAGNTPFTINGTGFADGATILFDGIPATDVVFIDSTQLTGVTPAHQVGPVTVQIINP